MRAFHNFVSGAAEHETSEQAGAAMLADNNEVNFAIISRVDDLMMRRAGDDAGFESHRAINFANERIHVVARFDLMRFAVALGFHDDQRLVGLDDVQAEDFGIELLTEGAGVAQIP